ncbi:MAG TPA: TIGR04076 family protein [candidate division WOR-3 bacterium]|uniref:TIGR04076 family protein n=1 Tax=candidate division WOR-3 bacterium TaxID=2052148 RepID=A0A9C9EL62_UNCW3|nr:TIGR04076 family protein [candidate division WOR-3 bacterium]
MPWDLKIEVYKINGSCPVYKKGDVFYIKSGFKLKSENAICMHSLASIMPYYTALSHGVSAKELGLGENAAYVQCLDPCEQTNGGTVVFEITRSQ